MENKKDLAGAAYQHTLPIALNNITLGENDMVGSATAIQFQEEPQREQNSRSMQKNSGHLGNSDDGDGTPDETANGEGQPFLLRSPPAKPNGKLSNLEFRKHSSGDYSNAHPGSSSHPNQEPTPTFASEDHKKKAELMAQDKDAFRNAFSIKRRELQEFHRTGGNRQKFSHENLQEVASAANLMPAEISEGDVANNIKTAVRALQEIPEDLWGNLQQRDDSTASDCAAELNAAVEALLTTVKKLQHFSDIKTEIAKMAASEPVQQSLKGVGKKDDKSAKQRLEEILKETYAKAKKDILKEAAPSLISAAQYLEAASMVAAKTRIQYQIPLGDAKSPVIANTVGLERIAVILGEAAEKMTAKQKSADSAKFSTAGKSNKEIVDHYLGPLERALSMLPSTIIKYHDKKMEKKGLRYRRSDEKPLPLREALTNFANSASSEFKTMAHGIDSGLESAADYMHDKLTKLPSTFHFLKETILSKLGSLSRMAQKYYVEEFKYTLEWYDPEEAAIRVALSTAGLPLLNEAYILQEAIDEFLRHEKEAKKDKKRLKAFALDSPTASLQSAATAAILSEVGRQ